MITKNTKLKRSYECTVKWGSRTLKFRNDEVPDQYKEPHSWAQVVLTKLRGLFGPDLELIRVVDRKAKK